MKEERRSFCSCLFLLYYVLDKFRDVSNSEQSRRHRRLFSRSFGVSFMDFDHSYGRVSSNLW